LPGFKFDYINSYKEFDLLLLSQKRLETEDVKQLTSVDFLKELREKEGMMLAIVDRKR